MEEPKDDTVGDPVGTVTTAQEPSRWYGIKRRIGWWWSDFLKNRERHREVLAALKTLQHGTEADLRELKAPWPRSKADLLRIIQAVTKRQHDYGTCVYAMSIAAEASYNYVAHVLGVTGFQASCADLDFLKRTRGWKMGFSVINYEDLLYPQYADRFPTRAKVIKENIKHLGKAAAEKLAEVDRVHPDVKRHWEDLVDQARLAA